MSSSTPLALVLALATAVSACATPSGGEDDAVPARQGASSTATPIGSGTSTVPARPTEADVRQRLERMGYTDVIDLKEGENGTWVGKGSFMGYQHTVGINQDGDVFQRDDDADAPLE